MSVPYTASNSAFRYSAIFVNISFFAARQLSPAGTSPVSQTPDRIIIMASVRMPPLAAVEPCMSVITYRRRSLRRPKYCATLMACRDRVVVQELAVTRPSISSFEMPASASVRMAAWACNACELRLSAPMSDSPIPTMATVLDGLSSAIVVFSPHLNLREFQFHVLHKFQFYVKLYVCTLPIWRFLHSKRSEGGAE